jgi:hypothetical protein
VREVVLLLGDVVGLQRRRGNLDGVGEDLLALLDLLELVGDGLFFVFDLRDGVTRLRRIEDDAGTELRVRGGLQCRGKSDGECGNDQFLHCLVLSFAVGVACSYSDTALLLCGKNFSLESRKTVGLWLAPCVSFFLLGFEGRHLLRGQLLSVRSLAAPRYLRPGSPWHRPGIRRCIDPATASPFPLCSDSRQGQESTGQEGEGNDDRIESLLKTSVE